MYVLIDTDLMQVVGKHPNVQYLNELGILTCSESSCVFPLEVQELLKLFSAVDLQRIYISLTGNRKGCVYPLAMVGKIIHYYLNAFPETVIADNIGQQAQWAIDNNKQGSCGYNPQGDIPTLEGECEYFKTTFEESVESTFKTEPARPTNMGQQGAWEPVQERSARAAPASQNKGTAGRTAGTREVIFAKADSMWESAGKPTDKKVILMLRKDIMGALELEGVKRNTSSNTLGLWVKERGLN